MSLLNVTGLWTGAALQSTANYCTGQAGELNISPVDRDLLRELAEQVADRAALPLQGEKRSLWQKHNDLETTRPVVFCDPENGWNEIITEEQLACSGTLARRWEVVLRKELFWSDRLQDDKVIEPYFDLGYTCTEDDWGVHWQQRGGHGGSYIWEPALKEVDDVKKLHPPKFEVDFETTNATVSLARAVFGEVLTVRLLGIWWWSFGLTLDLSLWRGLEQIMLDMFDRPQFIHELMTILRDGYLQKLEYLEQNNLLSSNVDQYVGSGGFGYTNALPSPVDGHPVSTNEMWGFCESQETVGVSPEMFSEFIYPYQIPFLEKFGLNCYGCCEPLDVRWNIIKTAPNLRRVSVSSWADIAKMAELLEDKYLFSWKPSPADLARRNIDEGKIREKIRRALIIAKDCNLEIIMKDNHTIGKNPENLVRWVQIVREEIDRIHG